MNVSFDVLVTGLVYAEGPVWLGPRDVAFVELGSQRVQRWTDGTVRLIARPGGAPNGATLGADGKLYVANNGGLYPLTPELLARADDGVTGRIQRISLDGVVEDLVTALPRVAPWRPNDLRFGPGGWLYFTDPGNWEAFIERTPYTGGALCRFRPEAAGAGPVEVVRDFGDFPNGLAFSPDWQRLYLAHSANGIVQVMDVEDGALGPAQTFCKVPEGGPDGITLDSEGRLYVCGSVSDDGGDAIYIYAPDGTLETRYDLSRNSDPTNLCIGDGGIYVTLGLAGQLIFIRHDAQPAALLP
ncbi:MAG TPA: SMP-30/gluconolactonase/LRE family protein [Candidatus Limnocylindrales bacterium]